MQNIIFEKINFGSIYGVMFAATRAPIQYKVVVLPV